MCELTTLPRRTFYECRDLVSFNVPKNVREIGDECFYGCEGLSVVNVYKRLNSVGDRAFSGCPALKNVNYDGTKPMFALIHLGDGNEAFALAYMKNN